MLGNIGRYWKISEFNLQTSFDNTKQGLPDNNGQNMTIYYNIG